MCKLCSVEKGNYELFSSSGKSLPVLGAEVQVDIECAIHRTTDGKYYLETFMSSELEIPIKSERQIHYCPECGRCLD